MRRLLIVAVMVVALAVVGAGVAANPPGTGQPSQTCLSTTAPSEPGNASSAPGSAFNENGGVAGGMYAGSQPQNSKNPTSVSQYDVACFQVSQR
ncbi:MAG: adenylate cyclase [Gaiellaceae bacterium]